MGSPAIGPLAGILNGGAGDVAAEASRTLAAFGARRAAVYLLRPALAPGGDAKLREAAQAALARLQIATPRPTDAVETLLRQAEIHLQLRQPLPENADGRVDLWRWDTANNAPPARVTVQEKRRGRWPPASHRTPWPSPPTIPARQNCMW